MSPKKKKPSPARLIAAVRRWKRNHSRHWAPCPTCWNLVAFVVDYERALARSKEKK